MRRQSDRSLRRRLVDEEVSGVADLPGMILNGKDRSCSLYDSCYSLCVGFESILAQ